MTSLPGNPSRVLPPADEQELVRAFAVSIVGALSPDELDLFDETAEEYFEDPEGVLDPDRRDEAVGFGLEAIMITPVVLAVATPVVQFLAGLVTEATREITKPVIVRTLRRILRIRSDAEAAAGTPLALTRAQVQKVHDVALQRARSLGLAEDQAHLLADSVAGGVVVPS